MSHHWVKSEEGTVCLETGVLLRVDQLGWAPEVFGVILHVSATRRILLGKYGNLDEAKQAYYLLQAQLLRADE